MAALTLLERGFVDKLWDSVEFRQIFIINMVLLSRHVDQVGKTVDCNAALGAVISYSKPFVLGVVTDEDEGGQGTANNAPEDKSNRGFRLVYNQQPCMSGKK